VRADGATLSHKHLHEPLFAHLRRDFPALLASHTVAEALASLRAKALGERIIYFYVVDEEGRLVGVVPTRRLLMAGQDERLESLMVPDPITLPAHATVGDASEMFLEHRFLAFPVVDSGGVLHGVADVGMFTGELSGLAERHSAEDAFQLIGIHLVAGLGPWAGFRDRFPWLLANVGGGLMAAWVTSRYQSLLDSVVVLALFIPVVLALAESVSIQSVTLTLQSLHDRQAGLLPRGRSLTKELGTATLLGLGCGGIVGGVAGLWQRDVPLGATILVAITASMITASVLGVLLPSTLRWLRRDPSIASGPIVLALADIATLLFYFNLAGMLGDRLR